MFLNAEPVSFFPSCAQSLGQSLGQSLASVQILGSQYTCTLLFWYNLSTKWFLQDLLLGIPVEYLARSRVSTLKLFLLRLYSRIISQGRLPPSSCRVGTRYSCAGSASRLGSSSLGLLLLIINLLAHQRMYSGLRNSGGTCYMNALLQALFFTPQFRNALFSADLEKLKDSPDKSIPFQLALLFARMSLRTGQPLKTEGLTKAFKWTKSQLYQQHDASEFMFLLIQSVRQALDDKTFAQKEFNLQAEEYVYCPSCGKEKSKLNTSCDLILPVMDFASGRKITNIYEALELYLKASPLEDYSCEGCSSRVTAEIGTKLCKLPLVLNITLNRFTYDMQKGQRVKLSHFVYFPFKLVLDPFFNTRAPDASRIRITGLPTLIHGQTPQPLLQKQLSELFSAELFQTAFRTAESEPTKPKPQPKSYHMPESSCETACQQYQLYCIVIQAGGAFGGHYWVLIKCQLGWVEFDDEQVKVVSQARIATVLGTLDQSKASGTTAYNLFYRQPSAVQEWLQPPKILLQFIEQQEREHKKELERKLNEVSVCVFDGQAKFRLVALRQWTVRDLLRHSCQQLGIQANEDLRLRMFDPVEDQMRQTFTGREDSTLRDLQFDQFVVLAIERRVTGRPFAEFDPDSFQVHVCHFRPGIQILDQTNLQPLKLGVKNDATVAHLLLAVGCPESDLLFKDRVRGRLINLQEAGREQRLVFELGFFNKCQVYVQEKGRSNWKTLLQSEQYLKRWEVVKADKRCVIYGDLRQGISELKNKVAGKLGVKVQRLVLQVSGQQITAKNFSKTSTAKVLHAHQRQTAGEVIIELSRGRRVGLLVQQEPMGMRQFRAEAQAGELFDSLVGEVEGHFRVRTVQDDRFGLVLREQTKLQQFHGQTLCVELVDQAEELRPSQVLVYYCWQAEVYQVVIDSLCSFEELSFVLAEYSTVERESLEVGQAGSFVLAWKERGKAGERWQLQDGSVLEGRPRQAAPPSRKTTLDQPVLRLG